MPISYLKIKPEKAVTILEKWIVEGYKIKDMIVLEYTEFKPRFGDNSFTNETIEKWREWVKKWTNECIKDIAGVFVSQRELYNFRDSRPPFGVTSEDVRYIGLVDTISARISRLNQYTEFILQQFNIKFTVKAGRDSIVQIGHDPKMEIKND